MSKRLLVVLVLPLVLCGCFITGKGKHYGYVTTTESGIIWDRIYIKTDNQSSQEEFYVISKANEKLKTSAEEFAKNRERVCVKFNNHFALAVADIQYCGGEVYAIEEVK